MELDVCSPKFIVLVLLQFVFLEYYRVFLHVPHISN